MKVKTDEKHIYFMGDNNLDTFFIGKMSGDLKSKNVEHRATCSPGAQYATLAIVLEKFPGYLIKLIDK